MTTKPPQPLPTTSASAAKEEVMRSLVSDFMTEKQRERDVEAAALLRKDKRRVPTLVVASIACLVSWVAPLPRPVIAPAPTPVGYTVASGRISLQLAASRIRAYQSQRSRLPESLLAAGVHEPEMLYQRGAEGQFVLRLVVGATLLTFDSSVAPTILQDDIQSVLRQTGR